MAIEYAACHRHVRGVDLCFVAEAKRRSGHAYCSFFLSVVFVARLICCCSFHAHRNAAVRDLCVYVSLLYTRASETLHLCGRLEHANDICCRCLGFFFLNSKEIIRLAHRNLCMHTFCWANTSLCCICQRNSSYKDPKNVIAAPSAARQSPRITRSDLSSERYDTVRYGAIRCDTVRYGAVRYK